MDTLVAVNTPRDDAAERLKFESFRLGKGLPSSLASKRHSFHARSHSRNGSISSLSSAPTSDSLALSTSSSEHSSLSLSTSISGSSLTMSKRNSHHRRRSSVSTRHESAEMMGVSVPDLPPSNSDDNVNFGEKDSVRRRALWALEGKADMAFSKVEIPELSTPVLEKKLLDFSLKPSLNNQSGSFGSSNNSLLSSGKRDSFKLLSASSSSKDQLHTLLEEEEEEEVDEAVEPFQEHTPPPESPDVPASIPCVAITKSSPARPRPSTLNLRPLSLTPECLVTSNGLPTPSISPSPRPTLKTLALASSFLPSPTEECPPKSQTSIMTPSSTPPLPRRVSPHSREGPSSIHEDDVRMRRRSSIGYRSSSSSSSIASGLPTPEHTPISDRRYSLASTSSEDSTASRPLSLGEQHFLFKQHNALLARITDLERALSSRDHSIPRPLSSTSDLERDWRARSHSPGASMESHAEPDNEMFRLVSDLKGERDELKRDVDGWRQRVGDLEKQIGVFAKRVDNERREAWVARSRVGLLEVEKTALDRNLSAKTLELEHSQETCNALRSEIRLLKEQQAAWKADSQRFQEALSRSSDLERECASLRARLDEESSRREELERELEKAELLATPTPQSIPSSLIPAGSRYRGLGFTSIDSESSMTDVESVDDAPRGPPLKVVHEADEEDCYSDDNGLAGYEDEDDSDISFQSPGGSSCGSEAELPRSVSHLLPSSGSPSKPSSPSLPSVSSDLPPSSHSRRASLSKTWTFPKMMSNNLCAREDEDRFFSCLEDSDKNSPPSVDYSYECSRSLFTQGLQDDGDVPFLLPSDVGVVVDTLMPVPSLGVLVEEDEEDVEEAETSFDEDSFGVAGGITITFTPAEDDCDAQDASFTTEVSESESLTNIEPPRFVIDEDDSDTSMSSSSGPSTPASVISSHTPRKSNIPRPKSPSSPSVNPSASSDKPVSLFNEDDFDSMSSPRQITPPRWSIYGASTKLPDNSFSTPPSKRISSSFIPQSISSPSPVRPSNIPIKSKTNVGAATFTRQPVRKSPLASTNVESSSNGSTSKPQIFSSSTFSTNIHKQHNVQQDRRSLGVRDVNHCLFVVLDRLYAPPNSLDFNALANCFTTVFDAYEF
ncbi:hypothetical protein ONZ45_g81 [Pleurotus djamor]|nr:hypothetical protein ONZ45_g81 [Pleurotus djamor]